MLQLGICHKFPIVKPCVPVFGAMPCSVCHSFLDKRILQVKLENDSRLTNDTTDQQEVGG